MSDKDQLPNAAQYNTDDPMNEAGKPIQEGTVFTDKDPEYLDDPDSVWQEV